MKHNQLRRFTGIGSKTGLFASADSSHEGLQPKQFSTGCKGGGNPAGMDRPAKATCPRCGHIPRTCLLSLKHHLRHWGAAMNLKWGQPASQTPTPHASLV